MTSERSILLDSGSAALLIWDTGEDGLDAEPWAGNSLVRITEDAAEEGVFIDTGDQYGPFSVTTRQLDSEPPVGAGWEDVVEFSVTISGSLEVSEPETRYPSVTLADAPGAHTIRVSARGRARDGDFGDPDNNRDEPIESYLIEAWLAAPSPARVVRITSELSRRELAGPPPRPDIPAADAGLAAAARICRDVDRAEGARSLSGKSGSLKIERKLEGPRRRWIRLFEDQMTWVSWWTLEASGWSLHGPGDPDQLGWARYGMADADATDRISGTTCALRVAVIERQRPGRVVRSWNWVRLPQPGTTWPPASQWQPFLPIDALQTTVLRQTKDSNGQPWTHVSLEHERLPIEWIDDMTVWWTFQLDIAEHTLLKK